MRLGVPGYAWGVEILHGAQSMCIDGHCPTIFPVLANLAAGFNASTWRDVGAAISTEMRAANNMHVGRTDCPTSAAGTNGWGPNVNLVRDPRWGRNIEVGSECPFVSGALGAAMIQGLQATGDSEYVKLLASIKHFSVYSMESSDGANRSGFDPTVAKRDMSESYLPAFKAAIVDGGCLGMMCSYTSVNGTPFCESAQWLTQWARRKHGFDGNVVTDCGALSMPGPEAKMDTTHNAAKALQAGTDLNCGQPWAFKNLGDALAQGLVSEAQLDETVSRSLSLRMRTGMFDPLDRQPYTRIGAEQLGAAAHHQLAYDAAAQGLVLLQNPRGASGAVLPLDAGRTTAVIGPHANATRSLLGSYFDAACPPAPGGGLRQSKGPWDCVVTPLDAIGANTGATNPPTYSAGCPNVACGAAVSVAAIAAAAKAAAAAEQVVVLLGLDEHIENEGRDRTDTKLPGAQAALLQAVVRAGAGKPVVVVLVNGGIVSVDALLEYDVAVVEAWYPGVEGGRAIADALFGVSNRWGKLPVTVYRESFATQVPMLEMSFTKGIGRTYKYWRGDAPLYEFGHGLSLVNFSLAWAAPAPPPTVLSTLNDSVALDVALTNEGGREGEEVIFVFHAPRGVPGAPLPLPAKRLVAFERRALGAGASTRVRLEVSARQLGLVDEAGDTALFPGEHALVVSRGHGDSLALNVSVRAAAPLVIESWV